MRSSNNQVNLEAQEELPPRRPLHRLHRDKFCNLIHNYGFENTPRVHIPSNWDIVCPRQSNIGTNPWGPKNKHIMAEVEKNTELLHRALRKIQGLRELLMVILENTSSSPPPSSSPKENWVSGMALPLASAKLGGGAPLLYHPTIFLPLLILVQSIVIFCFRWIKV